LTSNKKLIGITAVFFTQQVEFVRQQIEQAEEGGDEEGFEEW
jgi:hypothetical protein